MVWGLHGGVNLESSSGIGLDSGEGRVEMLISYIINGRTFTTGKDLLELQSDSSFLISK